MATSKAYILPETILVWKSTGGDELLTLTSVADSAGWQGARHDFGTTARSPDFAWRAWIKVTSAATVGKRIKVYWLTSDGTSPDNDDGTGDIALSAEDKLLNLNYLGAITIDEASSSPVFAKGGTLEHKHRYGHPVFFNESGVALSATATDHGFSLLPVPLQGQAT